MEPFVVVGALVFVGVGVVSAVMEKRQNRRRALIWRALAQRRGGTCNELPGQVTAATPPDSVDVRVAHAVVRLDRTTRTSGSNAIPVTRGRARFSLGAGPTFEVTPAGILSGVARNIGLQDLELGDPGFRYAFVVKGAHLDDIRRVWTIPLQRAFTRRLPAATMHSDGTHVTLTLAGSGEETQHLDAILDLVGALASTGAAEFEALAALPEVTLVPASGPRTKPPARRLRLTTAHGEATATLQWVKSAPRIWLTLPTSRDLPPFRIVVRDGTADGLPTGLLSEYALRLLGELNGVLLLSEAGKLDVRWLGIPTPDGLMVGAKLLGELAGGTHHVGAFR